MNHRDNRASFALRRPVSRCKGAGECQLTSSWTGAPWEAPPSYLKGAVMLAKNRDEAATAARSDSVCLLDWCCGWLRRGRSNERPSRKPQGLRHCNARPAGPTPRRQDSVAKAVNLWAAKELNVRCFQLPVRMPCESFVPLPLVGASKSARRCRARYASHW